MTLLVICLAVALFFQFINSRHWERVSRDWKRLYYQQRETTKIWEENAKSYKQMAMSQKPQQSRRLCDHYHA